MLARLGNVFTDAKRLLIGAAVVAAVSILLANVALRFSPQRVKPPSFVIGFHLPAGRNRTAAPTSDAKAPVPQVGEDRAPATVGPAASDPSRPARRRLPPRTTPAKHFSFSFERPLHRQSRSVVLHNLLFMNTNHNEGYSFFTGGKAWCESGLTKGYACFGYYGREVVFFPKAGDMQACSFAKDSDWDVPLMIRTQNPLKAQESYKNYLNYNKDEHTFYCAGDPHAKKCKRSNCKDQFGKNTGADVGGWPCMHNYSLNELAYSVVVWDYRKYHLKNPERAQMMKFLRRECRFAQNEAKDHQPVHRAVAVEIYVAVFAKYARCLMQHGDNWEQYCPNPCKNPTACSGENMLSICYPVESDNNKYQMLIDMEYFAHLKPIFKYVKYCECITGYFYSMETESCEPKDFACQNAGDCLHNGRCEPVTDLAVREIIGRNFNCRCPPAWQGLRCEEANDPCRIPVNRQSCGKFQCRRSPSDDEIGFTCLCLPGYTLTRENILSRKDHDNRVTSRRVPSCRDVNECAVTAPCRNGGNCVNTVGSFKCNCVRGFSGQLCEVPPLPPHWLEWEEWSACSVTCSGGIQHRMRDCSITGSCMGSRKAFKTCVGRFLECSDEALVGIDPMTLAGGAGWREEEDAILDDAWYFQEFQLLRLGMNKLTTAEEELLIGMEESMPIVIPYSVCLVLLEVIILLVLFWRIRLHRLG